MILTGPDLALDYALWLEGLKAEDRADAASKRFETYCGCLNQIAAAGNEPPSDGLGEVVSGARRIQTILDLFLGAYDE